MNKKEIVDNLVSFIENAERELQVANFTGESKIKNADIVCKILNELESELKGEN